MKTLNIKKVCLCFCTIILLLYGLNLGWQRLFLNKNSFSEDEPISLNNNPFSHLSYYREGLYERYRAYQTVASNLSNEDIVTHVNMGIDMGFYQSPAIEISDPDALDVLVNKFFILPNSWEPNDLVLVNPTREQYLNKRAADAFFAFQEACQQEGFTITAYSGYRSTAYQNKIYNNMIAAHGQQYTDRYVARPGQSEHATGLCVDISIDGIYYEDIEGSPHYTWFVEHLTTYGFILRYPKDTENLTGYGYESWHIRYLGEDLAQKVIESGLTYDEYVARK